MVKLPTDMFTGGGILAKSLALSQFDTSEVRLAGFDVAWSRLFASPQLLQPWKATVEAIAPGNEIQYGSSVPSPGVAFASVWGSSGLLFVAAGGSTSAGGFASAVSASAVSAGALLYFCSFTLGISRSCFRGLRVCV